MACFLVTTDHLSDRIWFKNVEDYKVGMNYVAIAAFILKVKVAVFILMSNHVHFIIFCNTEAEAREFADYYKNLYSRYYRNKYGVNEFLKEVGVDVREIEWEGEAFERATAYVMMNSVAANICMNCTQYSWGTGSLYFNQKPEKGTMLKDLSRRAQIRLLHSNVELPQNMIMLDDGYISPASYVDVQLVEQVFRTPKRMLYFLNTSSKAKVKYSALPSFRDQTINSAAEDICRTLFNTDSMEALSKDQKTELAQQLRFRFGADVAQLCRVIGSSYEEASKMLDPLHI